MNFYSNDQFCEAFHAAYYSNQAVKPALFKLGEHLWQLPAFSATEIVPFTPFESTFIDFFEPCEIKTPFALDAIPNVSYLPRVSHGMVTTAKWFDRQLNQFYEPAPTILWKNFQTWSDFMSNHRSKTLASYRRKKRKLEQDVGTLVFVYDDRRPEAMIACMKWKSEQYQRSKLPDLFAHEQHVHLFKELAERGLLLTSSLSAGEQIVAAHMGVFTNGRLYWWIPSYDTAYSKYSPGRLLLETLLEESFRQGHTEFDFLIDDASYKWDYATHTRLIAELGSPPLPLRLRRVPQTTKKACKSIVRRSLQPFPRVLNMLKKIRQTMKS